MEIVQEGALESANKFQADPEVGCIGEVCKIGNINLSLSSRIVNPGLSSKIIAEFTITPLFIRLTPRAG
jgi:hypothetical protein